MKQTLESIKLQSVAQLKAIK